MAAHSVVLIDPDCEGHHLPYATALASGLHLEGVEIYAIGEKRFVDALRQSTVLTDFVVMGSTKQSGISGAIRRLKFLFSSLTRAQTFQPTYIHLLQLDGYLIPLFLLLPCFQFSKIFTTLHWGYFLEEFIPDRLLYRIKAGLQRAAFRRLAHRGLGVIVHSQKLAQLLDNSTTVGAIGYAPYPVELPVVPNKLDLKNYGLTLRAQLAIAHDAILLLCFGGTRFDKGADIAIRALPYLPANVYLLIAGKEEHFTSQMLKKLGRELGVDERIKIHAHFIPDDQITNYFAAADVVIIPYRNPFSGQSGPLMIAALLGVPVVASNSIALEETVVQYSLGAIFRATDSYALATAVINIISSDQRPNTQLFRLDHRHSIFCQAVFDYYVNHTAPYLRG